MARFIPQAYQDYILNKIVECDEQVVCSAAPTTYYQCLHPDMWLADTVYVAGDLIRPPVANGFIYECTVGGTSGSVVPGWGTVQDQTFSDNTITWKTHTNVALVNTPRIPGDFSAKFDYSANGVTGRAITLSEKQGIIVHTAGVSNHCALIEHSTKELRYVTPSSVTIGTGELESGRTTIFLESTIVIANPIALP
jgi:hypothetical protein